MGWLETSSLIRITTVCQSVFLFRLLPTSTMDLSKIKDERDRFKSCWVKGLDCILRRVSPLCDDCAMKYTVWLLFARIIEINMFTFKICLAYLMSRLYFQHDTLLNRLQSLCYIRLRGGNMKIWFLISLRNHMLPYSLESLAGALLMSITIYLFTE